MFEIEKFKNDLKTLVNIDSGTFCLDGVRKVNSILAEKYVNAGWSIKWFEHTEGPLSNSFLVYNKSADDLDLLVLCHSDTVFPEGTVSERPLAVSDDGSRITGPGVADMKAGCLFALYVAQEFIKQNPSRSNLAIFCNGQHEEGGSIGTRAVMEELSKKSKVVVAVEPARSNGNCLKQRKGIARYTVTFKGISAHAGVNPQDGACAITEMAHWIIYLSSLTDYSRGVTVNCGVVKGGSVVNAVADFAELKIDVRVEDYEDAKEIEKIIFDKLNHRVSNKIQVEIKGRITRPPMKPDAATEKLCDEITKLGSDIGLNVTWGSSGGGSDASFASGVGVIALDGLGAVGGGMHTDKEYLELNNIDKRYKLFKDVVSYLTK